MTQTEGNHGGNRRQSQVKVTKQKRTNRLTEAMGEGPQAATRVEPKISSTGTDTGTVDTMTKGIRGNGAQ